MGIFQEIWAVLDFGEVAFVAFVGGVHPDVPPAEIDAVVSAEVFVVEVVVGRGVEPAAEAVAGEPFWKHLVPEVAGDVENGHPKEEGEEGDRVDGKGEGEEHEDAGFDDGFEGVE